jgi:hypothetical protein
MKFIVFHINMTSHCSDPVSCLNGNCVGCKDGQVWCQDPRCAPYCPGTQCAIPADHDFNANIMIGIILICLTTIFFMVWFVYGPRLFEPHDDHVRAGVIMPTSP